MNDTLKKFGTAATLQQHATPGDWLHRLDWCPQDITVRDTRPLHEDDNLRIAVQPAAYQSAENWPANAAFIAAAGSCDLPAVYNYLASLIGEVNKLRQLVQVTGFPRRGTDEETLSRQAIAEMMFEAIPNWDEDGLAQLPTLPPLPA